jgi:beta-1,4-N-acetylgalactosaminyltransferase 2
MTVTAIITTFERPEMCLRLIASAREHCPDVRLLVVDDSRNPHEWLEADDRILMPYDSGLSAKRNAGVARVGTGWVVILDDDFICTEATDLNRLARIADESGFDILGGEVIEQGTPMRYHGFFDQTGNHVVMRRGWTTENGIHACKLIPNFFAARAETLAAHPWDDALKLAEHSAYFWRWQNALKVGWVDSVAVVHDPQRPEGYTEMRMRAREFFQGWLDRQRLCWTDMHGTTMRCRDC